MYLCRFEHCFYNGNVKKDYFLFLLKKRAFWMAFLFLFSNKTLNTKQEKLVLLNKEFKTSHQNKLHYEWLQSNSFLFLTTLPSFLICLFIDEDHLFHRYSDKHFNAVIDTHFSKYLKKAKNKYLYDGKTCRIIDSKFMGKYIISKIIDILSIVLLSLFIEYIIFYSSSNPINKKLFESYYEDYRIFLMTLFPILCSMLFFYFLTNKVWLSFLITFIPFTVLAYSNFFKLEYRDYPVVFSDLLLLSEAKTMAGKYSIVPNTWHICILIVTILFVLILKRKKYYGFYKRSINILFCFSLLIVLFFGINRYMLTDGIYNMAGNNDVLKNRWIESQQLQRRGLLFSFIHSFNVAFPTEPENYNEDYARTILNNYQTYDIPETKKVNVISIMLESFNDFSKFNLELTEDIYRPLHDLQEEGYYGNLITNVFGGGTVDTERAFITGMYDQPLFNKPTNSYVQYLNSQGYSTIALHPCYGSFYNRRNINENLGYDNFYYYENRYHEIANDNTFFDDIIKEFESQTSMGTPYFNYSLTYQGHGPYPTDTANIPKYINNPSIDDVTLKTINTYLHGIKNTNQNLQKLKDYLQHSDEPTILVLFGDHNPVFGQGTIGFEKLGINMNLDTIDGFLNYYSTPYVFWANNACHKIIPNFENGQGPEISPHYLMNELFNYLGWKGNNYMQYTNDLKETIPVYHELYKKINNEYTINISEKHNRLIDDFKQVEYYYGYHFQN